MAKNETATGGSRVRKPRRRQASLQVPSDGGADLGATAATSVPSNDGADLSGTVAPGAATDGGVVGTSSDGATIAEGNATAESASEPKLHMVTTIPATVVCLRLNTVSANVTIRQGTNECIRILATTPAYWSGSNDGRIAEIGGELAAALALSDDRELQEAGGILKVNGVTVAVPARATEREQLVIEMPTGFAGNIDINADLLSFVSLEVQALRDLKVYAWWKAEVNVVDQRSCGYVYLHSHHSLTTGSLVCTGNVMLNSDHSGQLITGKITARNGKVAIFADNNSLVRPVGTLSGKNVEVKADHCGTVRCDTATSLEELQLEANNGSMIHAKTASASGRVSLVAGVDCNVRAGTVLTRSLVLETNVSGRVTVDDGDCRRLQAVAGVNSTITVSQGSADTGLAEAGINATITLHGAFKAVRSEVAPKGKVVKTAPQLDASDLFLRAGKRHFDRLMWDDQIAFYASISMAAMLAPALATNGADMLEALRDKEFADLFVDGIRAAYRDSTVGEALVAYADVIKRLITLDDVSNTDKLTAAVSDPKAQEAMKLAFQRFAVVIQEHMEHKSK
jgi:hypothetical protein